MASISHLSPRPRGPPSYKSKMFSAGARKRQIQYWVCVSKQEASNRKSFIDKAFEIIARDSQMYGCKLNTGVEDVTDEQHKEVNQAHFTTSSRQET